MRLVQLATLADRIDQIAFAALGCKRVVGSGQIDFLEGTRAVVLGIRTYRDVERACVRAVLLVDATRRGAPRAGDLDFRVERSSVALSTHAFATRFQTVVAVEAIPACADRMKKGRNE